MPASLAATAAQTPPDHCLPPRVQRRIRESEAVEERVTHIYDKKDWEEQMAQVRVYG